MAINKPTIFKNSLIYSSISILQKTVNFLLLPIYTRYMTPEDYGAITLVTSISSVLSICFAFTLQWAVFYFYSKYKHDPLKQKETLGTVTCFSLLFLLFLFLIIFSFPGPLGLQSMLNDISVFPYFFLGLLAVAGNTVFDLNQFFQQAKMESRAYAIASILLFVANVLVNLILVVAFNLGALGVLTGTALASFLGAIYALASLSNQIHWVIRWNPLKEHLHYWLPLLPHSIANWLFLTFDKVLINVHLSTFYLGLYGVGFQLGGIINIIGSAINQAYAPWFFDKINSEPNKIKAVAYLIVTLITWLSLGVSLFAKEILQIMTSPLFHDSWIVVPIIAFGYCFNGIYYIFVDFLFLHKTSKVSLITLSSSVIGFFVNLLVIPRAGYIGAAWVAFGTLFISSLLSIVLSAKYNCVGMKPLRMYSIVIFGFILALSAISVDPHVLFRGLLLFLAAALGIFSNRAQLLELGLIKK